MLYLTANTSTTATVSAITSPSAAHTAALTAEYQFIVAITTIILITMFVSSSTILSFNYIILQYLLQYLSYLLLYSGVYRVPDRVRRPAAAAGGCDPDRQRRPGPAAPHRVADHGHLRVPKRYVVCSGSSSGYSYMC